MTTSDLGDRPIRFAAVGPDHAHAFDLHLLPDLVHDVINRTETACQQRHTFQVMRLALTAQKDAAKRGYAQ